MTTENTKLSAEVEEKVRERASDLRHYIDLRLGLTIFEPHKTALTEFLRSLIQEIVPMLRKEETVLLQWIMAQYQFVESGRDKDVHDRIALLLNRRGIRENNEPASDSHPQGVKDHPQSELTDEQLRRKLAKQRGWRVDNAGRWWHDDLGDGPPPDYLAEVTEKSPLLYHRRGGNGRVRITMREFREMAERQPDLLEQDDLAKGCGCGV